MELGFGADVRDEDPGGEKDEGAEGREHEEGCVPADGVGEVKADGNTEDRGDGEGTHDETHGAPAALFGNNITDDREDDGVGDSAERTGKPARGGEREVTWSESAGEGGEAEAGVEKKDGMASIEAIEKRSRDETRDAGADRIGGNDGAELSGADTEDAHVLRAERHHDEEVEHGGELHDGEDSNERGFAEGSSVRHPGEGGELVLLLLW